MEARTNLDVVLRDVGQGPEVGDMVYASLCCSTL